MATAECGQATLTAFNCVSSYDWSIDNFKQQRDQLTKEFVVPFPYKIFKWKLILHPNGFDKKFGGYVSLFLNKVEPSDPVKITYVSMRRNRTVINHRVPPLTFVFIQVLGILDKDKRLVNKREFTHITFLEDGIGPGCAELVARSWLERYKELYLPNDTLTIRCIVDLSEAFANKECLERVEGESIASHGALNDFGNLLESQLYTDFTIKVGEQSIGVHRAILATRSDVLAAMFAHKMSENSQNVQEITDFEFDVVLEMLKFIYTGSAKAVSQSEQFAWDLLRCAEKYQLHELKTVCEKELIIRLTPKNAVETVTLSVFLHANRLLEASIDYIARKRRDVCLYSNVNEDLKDHPEILARINDKIRSLTPPAVVRPRTNSSTSVGRPSPPVNLDRRPSPPVSSDRRLPLRLVLPVGFALDVRDDTDDEDVRDNLAADIQQLPADGQQPGDAQQPMDAQPAP